MGSSRGTPVPLHRVPQLEIGQLLEFGLRDADGVRWYPSRLEDQDDRAERLLIAWPLEDDLEVVPLRVGDVAILAATCRHDALYSAQVQVESLEAREPRQLVVRAAGGWRRVQRRNAVRWEVAIRPTLAERLASDGWKPVRAVITDLSAGGLQIHSRDELIVGDRLDVEFSLPGIPGQLRSRLDVRHVEEHKRGSMPYWEAGCEFREPRAADSERIVQFIFAQQRARARREKGL